MSRSRSPPLRVPRAPARRPGMRFLAGLRAPGHVHAWRQRPAVNSTSHKGGPRLLTGAQDCQLACTGRADVALSAGVRADEPHRRLTRPADAASVGRESALRHGPAHRRRVLQQEWCTLQRRTLAVNLAPQLAHRPRNNRHSHPRNLHERHRPALMALTGQPHVDRLAQQPMCDRWRRYGPAHKVAAHRRGVCPGVGDARRAAVRPGKHHLADMVPVDCAFHAVRASRSGTLQRRRD
jgi:hypothetical protein